MAQIRLDSNAVPDQTTYAQHNGAESCDWGDIGKAASASGEQVPVVYAADASHASYYAAGSTATDASSGASTDDHHGNGRVVIPTLETLQANTPAWVGWPGKWGGSGASPRGPQWHGQWTSPQAFHDGAATCLLPASAARRGRRASHARDRGTIAPNQLEHAPAPRVFAHRRGKRVVVAYRIQASLPRGRRRPRSVLITLHRANRHSGPTGGFYRLRKRSGTAYIRLPSGGRGPYTVRASAYGKGGVRSRVVRVAVR